VEASLFALADKTIVALGIGRDSNLEFVISARKTWDAFRPVACCNCLIFFRSSAPARKRKTSIPFIVNLLKMENKNGHFTV